MDRITFKELKALAVHKSIAANDVTKYVVDRRGRKITINNNTTGTQGEWDKVSEAYADLMHNQI